MLTARSKLVDNLEQDVRTQLVDGLFADLLQVVRFSCVQPKSIVPTFVKDVFTDVY